MDKENTSPENESSRMDLSPFTLSFRNDQAYLEELFLKDYFNQSKNFVRAVCLVGCLLFLAYGVVDAFWVPMFTNTLWTLRYAITLPVLVALLGFVFSPYFSWKNMQVCTAVLSFLVGLSMVAMMVVVYPASYSIGLLLLILGNFTAIRARFIWASFTIFSIFACYTFAAAFFTDIEFSYLFVTDFFAASYIFVGMFACYTIEYFFRNSFFLTHRLEKEDEKVRTINYDLEQRIIQRTKELNDTRLEIIRRLGKAAEFKDEETGFHIIRISKMCCLMGKAAGLSPSRIELLENASPMHDIGKIGIPDYILRKPGPLNFQEREIMKSHAAIGGELLSGDNSPLLAMARDIAMTHHEKWDGSGYPKGLKGEEIPIAGRICALCDVFDALISKRPYKGPWPVDKVLEEIKNERSGHFDPVLVDLFIQVLPEILEIRKNFSGK